MNPRVFISYASADGEAFAGQLRERLERECPDVGLWQDRTHLEAGYGWWRQVEKALEQVRFLVLVMTPAALASENTAREWRYARQRGVNVYPVLAAPEVNPADPRLPNWMRKAKWHDLQHEWPTFISYLRSDQRPPRVPFMVPDLPPEFVARPGELERVVGLLLAGERRDPVAITTALQGTGGFGKTTLAKAICHDHRIQDAFDDGILWVTLGQKPNLVGEGNSPTRDCLHGRMLARLVLLACPFGLSLWPGRLISGQDLAVPAPPPLCWEALWATEVLQSHTRRAKDHPRRLRLKTPTIFRDRATRLTGGRKGGAGGASWLGAGPEE